MSLPVGKQRARRAFLLGAASALLVAILVSSRIARPAGLVHCPTGAAIVVVDTQKHALALCDAGVPSATYSVRIGKNGTGKSMEGDGKTPLGRFTLGEARASATYGLFLPVGYPNADQAKAGFTGGAIGVHGPDRRLRWLFSLANAIDTTDGCVGIATDAEMQKISAWTRSHGVREIVIQ